MEYRNGDNLNPCSWGRVAHIWLHSKLILIPFEVTVLFLCQQRKGREASEEGGKGEGGKGAKEESQLFKCRDGEKIKYAK